MLLYFHTISMLHIASDSLTKIDIAPLRTVGPDLAAMYERDAIVPDLTRIASSNIHLAAESDPGQPRVWLLRPPEKFLTAITAMVKNGFDDQGKPTEYTKTTLLGIFHAYGLAFAGFSRAAAELLTTTRERTTGLYVGLHADQLAAGVQANCHIRYGVNIGPGYRSVLVGYSPSIEEMQRSLADTEGLCIDIPPGTYHIRRYIALGHSATCAIIQLPPRAAYAIASTSFVSHDGNTINEQNGQDSTIFLFDAAATQPHEEFRLR